MTDFVERVDNALRVLRSVEDADFDLATWPRCVLGHCARDAWCNEQGFGLSRHLPTYEDVSGCDAGAKFFGIPLTVALHLFVTGDFVHGAYKACPSRKAVLAHLEVLRLKKLAEIETGGLVAVEDFVAVGA
jgi:hypothetical protein